MAFLAAPIQFAIISFLLLVFVNNVACDINAQIPASKSEVSGWFQSSVKPAASRKGTLNVSLEAAESVPPKIIKVRQGGGGDFKTVSAAIKSIPKPNKQRVIVDIGPGVYKEKVIIEPSQHFITLYGSDPSDKPTITWDDTAKEVGTDNSATMIVLSDFFIGVNIIIQNTAPKPSSKPGGQAVALRIWGDKAALYNCKLLGFQDTLCDDVGRHFYKDCYIEGTVDFIFGRGRSLFLNTQLNVVKDKYITVITAQTRSSGDEDTGFSFVHCSVTGDAKDAFLGRAQAKMPRTVFAYTEMGTVVNHAGWFNNLHPDRESTVSFGEYENSGPGFTPEKRVKYAKILSAEEVKKYLSLSFIDAAKWLLPPPKL